MIHKKSGVYFVGISGIFIVVVSLLILESNQFFWFMTIPSIKLSFAKPGRVVVGVSTFGERVHYFNGALDSILCQSFNIDRVVVSIPKVNPKHNVINSHSQICSDCFDSVPENISSEKIIEWFTDYFKSIPEHKIDSDQIYYEFNGSVIVHFMDKDPGPAAKLIGVLMLKQFRDGSTVIVTLDDDIIYNRNIVEYLATQIPEDSALSIGCQLVNAFPKILVSPGDIETSTITPENVLNHFWLHNAKNCPGWLLGWSGVAYRASFFDDDIFSFLDTLPKGCFFNDDVWLSGYLKFKNIPRKVSPFLGGGTHRRHQRLSLSTIPNTEVVNRLPCIHSFGWLR